MIKALLSSDLSIITGISKLSLDNLANKAELCISHALNEALLSKDNQCEIDIGIGFLYIKLEGDIIKYKFIPSKKLEEGLAFTAQNKMSALTIEADKSLGDRIVNAYRSLL